MNPDAVLAVLPNNKEEAKSLKEIAYAMGLDTSLIPIGSEHSARSPEFSGL
jgi:hypothetical protein